MPKKDKADISEIQARDIQVRTTAFVLAATLISFFLLSFFSIRTLAINEQMKTNMYYNALAEKIGWQIDAWLKSETDMVLQNKHAIEINGDFSEEYLTTYLQMIYTEYSNGSISELFFLSTDNELYCGSGFVSDGTVDFRTRDWYSEAVGHDEVYYTPPYVCASGDQIVVTVSIGVFDEEGEPVGVVGVDIPIDTMNDIIASVNVDENSYLMVIDEDQDFIAHPDPAYVTNDGFAVNARQIPNDPYAAIENVLNGDIAEDEAGTLKEDYDGERRNAYTGSIDVSGWRVVLLVSSDTIYRPIMRVMIILGFSLLLIFIFGLIIARTISKRVVARFKDAMEVANAANEAKSSFLANMSHEIRTPINAVAGMNEMILRENKDPVINDYALDIASASRSLTSIINDILDFSKIESGKLEIVEGEFNIASIINDCINLAISRLGDKDLELFFDADPNIPKLLIGDEMRIKQIMVNLMTNGIKYTNEGFVTMTVGYSRHDYGINLNVAVRDSGIGIKPEDMDKLFSSFKRLDTKVNQKVEGTGLGLSISKRLVGIMGGFINVTSEYGKGTEFRFSIPLKIAEDTTCVPSDKLQGINSLFVMDFNSYQARAAEECARVLADSASKLGIGYKVITDPSDLEKEYKAHDYTHVFADQRSYDVNKSFLQSISRDKPVAVVRSRYEEGERDERCLNVHKPLHILNMTHVFGIDMKTIDSIADDTVHGGFIAPEAKILIVDDNMMNLKVAVGLMKKYEMLIVTVDGGQKAVDTMANSQDFDVIFMDHMMPEVDGIEATRRIREMEGDYYKNVPIIALTANTVNEAREMFLSSGFDDFLAKPIDTKMLDRALRKFIPAEKKKSVDDEEVMAAEAARLKAASTPAPVSAPAPVEDSAPSKEASEPVKNEEPVKEVVPETPASAEPAQEFTGKNLDPETGLVYSAGDIDLYLDILNEYYSNGKSSYDSIKQFYETEDWKNYVIKVHALKSTSLTIGAKELSEKAKALEFAGREDRIDEIKNDTEPMLELFLTVLGEVKAFLLSKGVTPKEPAADVGSDDVKKVIDKVGKDKFNELLDKFIEACDGFDSSAVESIVDEAQAVGGLEFRALFDAAINHVNSFEYDEASEEIKKLKGDV
ncbi:MAG: response regulator [Clostridiales bacterium]|nr:response regulator [Clostridiales bacterium]